MTDVSRDGRYQAGATTFLHEHRAFMRQPDRRRIVLGASAMTVLLGVLWIAALPTIGRAWGHALAMLVEGGVPADVVMTVYEPWGLMQVGCRASPSRRRFRAAPSGWRRSSSP